MFLDVTTFPHAGQPIALRLINGAFIFGDFVRRYEPDKGVPLWTLKVNGAAQSFVENLVLSWSPQATTTHAEATE
jgi:hypothetical protein